MLRTLRFGCCIVVLVLVSAAGCDEDPKRPKGGGPPSASSSSSAPTTPTDASSPPTTTAPTDPSSGTQMSAIATRTGYVITHNGQPIDKAGLQALGWVVNPGLGNAQWADPTLGAMNVTWEVPDERAIAFFDSSFWGDVTGQNLAMNPTMTTTVFTGGPVEATAYSTGGVKAETPTQLLRVTVPEQPTGTAAKVEMNLGWPQPVLITYNYVYQ